MGMTMTQKILAAHAGLDHVVAGQLIEANLDVVLANDITAPVAINEFEKCGADAVFDNTRIALVLDHFTPNKDIKAAEQCLQTRNFANKYDIKNFFDVGQMGIEHALLPEKGIVGPGDCVIGADSHTCTYGALGRVLHRRGFHGHGCRYDHRQGLVQGAFRDQGGAGGQARPLGERQGCHPASDRRDRRGRRAV